MFSVSPILSFSNDSKSKTEIVIKNNKLSSEQINLLENRVNEIRNMNKSDMTSAEKREIRKELKGIKKNVRTHGDIIYISGGTLLLIILILLLI